MARARRVTFTSAVVICLLSTQWSGPLFASEPPHPPTDAAATPPATASGAPEIASAAQASVGDQPAAATDASAAGDPQTQAMRFTLDATRVTNAWLEPAAARTFRTTAPAFHVGDEQIYQGRPYRMRHDGSIAAIMIGAAAAITGTAVLVYANRPECSTNQLAGGCGYGTKVVGTAVLSGGIVGLFVGALTWR